MADSLFSVPDGYDDLLRDLKERIRAARIRAALAVNRELVLLYWQIGRDILTRQHQEGWGAKVVERLSADLRREFPDMRGFSLRNLVYMQTFAAAYPDEAFTQQVAAQIPWFHNCTILDKVHDPAEREWYIRATVQYGWSRNVLVHQIETGLYQRQGKAVTNFERALPAPQSDLARQMLKDPYDLGFLPVGPEAEERALEQSLLGHLRDFLLELGAGFAFVGSQYLLEVDGREFFLDLLFYHLKLRCYVIIDLKAGPFEPEHAGKMNFYLAAVDDLLRHPDDQPSIGLILCRSKSRLIAEYALRGTQAPMGVADYRLTATLPEDLRGSLPTVEDLEAGLRDVQMEDISENAQPEDAD